MKIAYFGGDVLLECLQELVQQGHEIAFLFTNKVPAHEYDMSQQAKAIAKEQKASIIYEQPTANSLQVIDNAKCDMIVSAGYPYKIPDWQTGDIKYAINIHPSLLPEGAGPMPLPHLILKDYKTSGITLHKLSKEWDRGDIILQKKFTVSEQDNMDILWKKARLTSQETLKEFLTSPDKHWDNATAQKPTADDYWKIPEGGGFGIDYYKDAQTVAKYLRIHYYIHLDGNIESIINIEAWKEMHLHKPGTVLFEEKGQHIIAVKDGFVKFKVIQEHR